MNSVRLGGRAVGDGEPVFVIAEAGVNHNGDVNLALRLIEAAAAAGADAVKFQAFVTEELTTRNTQKAPYQVAAVGAGAQYDMLKALELGADDHVTLRRQCDALGILYLCTPYDHPSADLLERLDIAAFKIGSTDTTNIPFLRHIAAKGRPVLLSTGMSTLPEVEAAVLTLKQGGLDGRIALLQCTTEYPAPLNELNLRAIRTLRKTFGCPVGFSDHSGRIEVAAWAVAAGACVIEKHLTLDKTMAGPDHRASLEPPELAQLVREVRLVEEAMGDGVKRPMPSELPNKTVIQKSLVARRRIEAGEVVTAADLACKRPAVGVPPSWFDRAVGQVAAMDINEGAPLTFDSVRWAAERPPK
jgi:N-acetylneuraminate synthase